MQKENYEVVKESADLSQVLASFAGSWAGIISRNNAIPAFPIGSQLTPVQCFFVHRSIFPSLLELFTIPILGQSVSITSFKEHFLQARHMIVSYYYYYYYIYIIKSKNLGST